MSNLTEHHAQKFTKLLLIGDSGSGKTGSLASLAKAGYKLRIIDLDNGLDALAATLRREQPAALANVDYVTLRDERKAGPGGAAIVGIPKAFPNVCKILTNWAPKSLGLTGDDLGDPSKWGPEVIVVIDSLTFLGDAAYDWAKALNPSAKDNRQIYGMAQEAVEGVINLLTSPDFGANVIVISHVRWVERPDGTTKGYPSAIGGALSPKIATYFNSTALAESVGNPPKRFIRTASTPLIDLKNPAQISPQMPIQTGLADFFKQVRT